MFETIFQLINHGLPASIIDKALKGVSEFFNLTEEEKVEYEKKDPADRIRWGLGFSPGDHEAVKREYLKVLPHPKFQGPDKPAGFRYKKIVVFGNSLLLHCKNFQCIKKSRISKVISFL